MKKISLLLVFLFTFICSSNCQPDSNADFQKQKSILDSTILAHQKQGFQERSIVGGDSILQTYKGVVCLDQLSIIRRIELHPDSGNAKIILFCIKNTVIAVKENNDLFYNIKTRFYNSHGMEETSEQHLVKFRHYNTIVKLCNQIFDAGASN